MNWLIDYPEKFACQTKLARKISHYLGTRDRIFYLRDLQTLLQKLDDSRVQVLGDELGMIDRALIFRDARKPPPQLLDLLRQHAISGHLIHTPITEVVNVETEGFDIYIGRGSYWGNPYAIGDRNALDEAVNDRAEAIRKFAYDFEHNLLRDGARFKQKLVTLRGTKLGCHCKPFACHGDILATYLNSLDDGR